MNKDDRKIFDYFRNPETQTKKVIVYILKKEYNWKIKLIAKSLNISEKTAWNYIARVHEELAEIFQNDRT